jgi:hypothetical protein
MVKHKDWTQLWWAILQHFGRESKKTWGSEVIAVAVGGIAGAATSYLRTRGQISFTDALVDGLVTAALFFGIYVFVHFLRSPWLERSSEGVPPSLMDGILGSVLFLLLLGGGLLICRVLAQDWRSELTLHATPDPGQLRAVEECKSTLASLTKPAPSNSLRHRTIEVVNELNLFWANRPTTPQQPVQNPATDDDRARNTKWERYWNETKVAYQSRQFNDRILGIAKEYLTKGVPVGYLERSAEQPDRYIGALPFGGFSLDACDQYMSELCQLRELAFHVDAYDVRIDSSKF